MVGLVGIFFLILYSYVTHFFLSHGYLHNIILIFEPKFDENLRNRLGLSGYNFVHKECNCISMAKNSLRLYEQVVEDHDNK